MSSVTKVPAGKLPSNQPDLWFEDNAVGRLKKEIWEASEEQLKGILAEYGFPAASCEWAKPNAYIQTTPHWKVIENRHKNDVVFIPVGCTELHGAHLPSATDTLFVSMICEGVRRYTEQHRDGHVNLALPPLNYGAHPYHHLGMPGTVIVRGMSSVTTLGLGNVAVSPGATLAALVTALLAVLLPWLTLVLILFLVIWVWRRRPSSSAA